MSAAASAPSISPLRRVWDMYASAWEDISSEERMSRLEQSVAEDLTYDALPCELKSRNELKAFIDKFREGAPKGSNFHVTLFVEHHNTALGHFVLRGADGTFITEGTDRVVFNAAGHMQHISAFFQKPRTQADVTSAKRAVWLDHYTAAWESCTPEQRKAHLDAAVAPSVTFMSPDNSETGRAALIELTTKFQVDFPGARFELVSFWEHHHDTLCVWIIRDAKGDAILPGQSYGRYDEKTGQIVELAGYWPAPA
jgi:hypothetical protein